MILLYNTNKQYEIIWQFDCLFSYKSFLTNIFVPDRVVQARQVPVLLGPDDAGRRIPSSSAM